MAQRRSKYIHRRGIVFQLRLPIPKNLHQAFEREELRWSLHTSNLEIAEMLALKARLAFLELCCRIRLMSSHTQTDIQKLVQEFYERLLSEAKHDPTPTYGIPPNDHIAYQDEHDDNYIAGRQLEADLNDYSTATKEKARAALKQSELFPSGLDSQKFLALCNGITRAEIELARYHSFRRKELILPYEPSDALFRNNKDAPLQSIAKTKSTISCTLTVSSPQLMYHLIVRFLGLVGACSGPDVGGWCCTV